MSKISFYGWIFVLSILTLLTIPYFLHILSIIFLSKRLSVWSQLEIYKWMACGFVLFFFLRTLLRKNLTWFETFSHELTHIIVALLLFRKVHSFHAEEGQGMVLTSGNNNSMLPPMALAPYCLPLFTYLLLSIRCLLDYHDLWIYDMLIGFTICFHIYCFKYQIGNHQTDINQYPLLFSYWYIILFWVINICIIAVAFFPKYNLYTSFWRYITAILENFTNTISFIF